jgi:predicted small metal-binding protein
MKKTFKMSCKLCNFEVKGHDRDEIIDHAMLHIKEMHNEMEVSRPDVSKMVK